MNDIEKIIYRHRADFDSEEPRDGHFDQFRKKIQSNQSHKTSWQWKNLMKVAAIFAFVLISGLTTYQIQKIKNDHFSLGQLSPEYQEVEQYFTSSINHQLNIIKELSTTVGGHVQEGLKEELANMDHLYKQLEKELKSNPKDERIIQAMIEHFQAKNNMLNRIVEQLYLVNRQNLSLANNTSAYKNIN